jgi:hypothetical protein
MHTANKELVDELKGIFVNNENCSPLLELQTFVGSIKSNTFCRQKVKNAMQNN